MVRMVEFVCPMSPPSLMLLKRARQEPKKRRCSPLDRFLWSNSQLIKKLTNEPNKLEW